MNKVIEKINAAVLEQLEKGIVPWSPTYVGTRARNYYSGRPYSGINKWLLGLSGLEDYRFMTFNQAKEHNVMVGQGNARWVVGWFKSTAKSKALPGEIQEDVPTKNSTYLNCRWYNVFPVCKTDLWDKIKDLPVKGENLDNRLDENDIAYDLIMKFTDNVCGIDYGPTDTPCYIPSLHLIKSPPIKHYVNAEAMYGTLFHEMAHATMLHFGRKLSYEREELVAECCSSLLLAHCGILTSTDNSAAYCASWGRKIRDDKQMIITAAARAEEAFKFILGIKDEVFEGESGD